MPRYIKQLTLLGLTILLFLIAFGGDPGAQQAAPANQSVPLGVKIETAMNTTCQQGCAKKWCKRSKCGQDGDKGCKAGRCQACWKKSATAA